MKKLFFGLITVALLSNSCTPAYVSTQPTYEEGFRPPRPSDNHVWVDGNWHYNRQLRAYKRSNGFWSMPYRGRRYQSGHWRNNSRGYYWNPGRWR
jgi:WXXGXW repeat (2 copies)